MSGYNVLIEIDYNDPDTEWSKEEFIECLYDNGPYACIVEEYDDGIDIAVFDDPLFSSEDIERLKEVYPYRTSASRYAVEHPHEFATAETLYVLKYIFHASEYDILDYMANVGPDYFYAHDGSISEFYLRSSCREIKAPMPKKMPDYWDFDRAGWDMSS